MAVLIVDDTRCAEDARRSHMQRARLSCGVNPPSGTINTSG